MSHWEKRLLGRNVSLREKIGEKCLLGRKVLGRNVLGRKDFWGETSEYLFDVVKLLCDQGSCPQVHGSSKEKYVNKTLLQI